MYHSVEEIKNTINEKPNLNEKLFCRGYLITDDRNISLTDYPFYGNWSEYQINSFRILVHKDQHFYYCKNESKCIVLIGNAVNPFKIIFDENELISELLKCNSIDDYIDRINKFTGDFFVGIFEDDSFIFTTDPTEMLFSSYGIIESKIYISSHPQLIGDLCGLNRSKYAVELENYRFFKKYGTFFPGNITQFEKVKRVLTNHYYVYNGQSIIFKRFYPTKALKSCSSREEYISIVKEVSRLLHNTMICAAKKWENAAISMTGGMDSKTTMSAAYGLYDSFKYYSYITMDGDKIDADAASKIAKSIGIEHKIYDLSYYDSDYEDIESVRIILEHNNNDHPVNDNDVRKRVFFDNNDDFDVEIKSWISEIGRANYYKKFGKSIMPKVLSPRNMTSMYKVFLTERTLAKETDKVFKEFIEESSFNSIPNGYDKSDMYLWEFRYSSWGGKVITSEHSYSYELFIPFNNRLLLDLMLRAPLNRRISDRFHDDLIKCGNRKIFDTGITITNWNETKKRMMIEKGYYNISSFFYFI